MDTHEIDDAIAAHAVWKLRLRTAIATGRIDVPVGEIRLHDACDLGRWLARTPAQPRGQDVLGAIRRAHAEFHEMAARIAELALAGRTSEAQALMSAREGAYASASARLTAAMKAWRENLVVARA